MDRGTYVYCLIAGDREPSLDRVANGPPGLGAPRLVPVSRGRWLVAASAPLHRFGEAALNEKLTNLGWVSKAAMAHEAVIESFSRMTSVLPMKLFTIFENDERAVRHVLIEGRRIDRLLKRLARREEWGVRVLLDRARAARSGRRASRIRTGAAYLAAKKAHQDQAAELASHAQQTISRLFRALDTQSDQSTRRAAGEWPLQGHSLLLDAAFLVPRTRSRSFRSLVARHARQLDAHGYIVDLTGPWPPYSFLQD
jgi:hypothetical protein